MCRTGVCGLPKTSRFFWFVSRASLTHFFLLCVWYRTLRGTEESSRLFHGCRFGVISVRFSVASSVCCIGVCGVPKTLLRCFMVVGRGSLTPFLFASPVVGRFGPRALRASCAWGLGRFEPRALGASGGWASGASGVGRKRRRKRKLGESPAVTKVGMLNTFGTSWGFKSAKTLTSGRVGFKD